MTLLVHHARLLDGDGSTDGWVRLDGSLVVARGSAGCEPEALIEFCVERMPRHMVPRYVEVWDRPLPRTPSEKVAKRDLRERGLSPGTWDRELGGGVAR